MQAPAWLHQLGPPGLPCCRPAPTKALTALLLVLLALYWLVVVVFAVVMKMGSDG